MRCTQYGSQLLSRCRTLQAFNKQVFVTTCAPRGLRTSCCVSSTVGDQRTKWSYEHGACDLPLLGVTIGKMMERSAQTYGSRDAFVSVWENTRVSHEQLLEKCDNLAAGFLSLGLKRGDRVGIWAPNCIEWAFVEYATARAGIVLVNVNPAYRVSELEFAMKKVGMKAIIAAEQFKTSNYYKMLTDIIPELHKSDPRNIKSERLPDLQNIIMISNANLPGTFPFSEVMEMGNKETKAEILDLQDKLQFDDPINIQFTSGTTGLPKGATLTHHNLLNNAYFVGYRMQYDRTSRLCIPVPLYHCLGMVVGGMTAITHGTAIVLPSAGTDPVATLEAIDQERCTSLYGTPTMFIDALEVPSLGSYDITSLHTGVMAGAPCPIEIMKQVREKLHMPDVMIAYGTTENSPVTFQTLLSTSVEKRVSTVGLVHPHVEAKITDNEDSIVARGVTGELCIRGYCVMPGYWEDPDKTNEVIGTDHWYKTGDLSVMDDEGYVQIVGRKKDMLIRGGENIFPVEIEQFLYTNPKISDVQVFGVHDKRLGEEICAWIKLKNGQSSTEDEIKQFCKDKIAHFKIPRYVKFVDEYPLTVTGKIQKFLMRKAAEEELGVKK